MYRVTNILQNFLEGFSRRMHSSIRSKRLTVVLGRWLGFMFMVCFITGLLSHYLQDPEQLGFFPTRPVWIYAMTQGLHITSGIAAIPLLLAKAWSVYPLLLRWPPIKGFWDFLERASMALFFGASLIQLFTGVLNTYQWYPWPFPFKQTHYYLAWVIFGSLIVHIMVKLPTIMMYWWRKPRQTSLAKAQELISEQRKNSSQEESGNLNEAAPDFAGDDTTSTEAWQRRSFLTAVGLSSGALILTTVGQSFEFLAPFNFFAPRRKGQGPQGVPVNRTAQEAGVEDLARDPGWSLTVKYQEAEQRFSLAQLQQMPLVEYELPIACVEGWSQQARWRGVPVRNLLMLLGAPEDSVLRMTSLEPSGFYAESTMPGIYSSDEQTLVALELNGSVLDIDHGYPARIIAPGRPGVLQTKWLARMEVIS